MDRILSVFDINLIKINIRASDKNSLFEMMIDDLYQNGIISEKESFLSAIKLREKELSTGIGYGIAIPHARHEVVKEMKAVIYMLSQELEYGSLDEKPVRIVVMLAIPKIASMEYMKMLGVISKDLHDQKERESLLLCEDKEKILNFFKRMQDES
ncbi:MAG: PTS sugar transporter subunit IIA [Candidatus Cloacimonetes bacterium]|nr:PTS sugar transporter subunit IIA [Candidatus Cloacimonadota bacterium]